jgi:protein involved in polysaccharide export with SLBB domain
MGGSGLARLPLAATPRKRGYEYRLGSGDKLRLKVYEWRRLVGQLQGWSALNGDYNIGADRTLSLLGSATKRPGGGCEPAQHCDHAS